MHSSYLDDFIHYKLQTVDKENNIHFTFLNAGIEKNRRDKEYR